MTTDAYTGTTLRYGHLTAASEGIFLYCPNCEERWSATRGDYWLMPDEAFVECGVCDEPLVMAREQALIDIIDPATL